MNGAEHGRGYVVLDFETTGFAAFTTDRVVEIGVVCVDGLGEITGEWTTLVNPERDVSAGFVHGITGRDVYAAPRFAEVAGLLAESLRDRVVVAHNLSFESRFLIGEFGRLGLGVQIDHACGICTMSLASAYIPHSPRNLAACCDCCGIELIDAHTALADARATAALLSRYQSVDREFETRWAERMQASLGLWWPTLDADPSRCLPRGSASSWADQSYMGRLAAQLPAFGGTGVTDSYLEVLDRALIDRILSLHEMDELVGLARDLGLSREQALAAHGDYVGALARQAWADGVVSDAEIADLLPVAGLLGITDEEVRGALAHAQDEVREGVTRTCGTPVAAFGLVTGDRVVFTGEAPGVSREELFDDAVRRGLQPMTSVSRNTGIVVAADPDSISGKARKAREYGVPVVDFATYFRLRGDVR